MKTLHPSSRPLRAPVNTTLCHAARWLPAIAALSLALPAPRIFAADYNIGHTTSPETVVISGSGASDRPSPWDANAG
ncbi:MAG: hypothetical protein LBM92_00425, partial [Opitutaceae bacterium]|nr:hypothetical protein [Opitutaceae bacterium]